MQLDDLLKGSIGLIWGFIKDIFFDKCCYAIGWIFIRIVSLGRSPANSLSEGLMDYESDDSWVAILGLIIVIGIATRVYFLGKV